MGDANDAATLRRLALLRRINALLGELAWDGEENPALYDAARKATHGGGMPWTDPRTGVTHQPPTEPPDRLQIRPATDAEQREAILEDLGRSLSWGPDMDYLLRDLTAEQLASALITGIERISRPGRRVYFGRDDVPEVLAGLGTAILTTSRGVMTGRAAVKAGVGGEVLCNIW